MKEEIAIPRGIRDGMTIKVPGKGNYNGDLLIKVTVGKNSQFIREGDNVFT